MTTVELEPRMHRYRAALAELAPRVREARGADADIRVIAGTGDWWEIVEYALGTGARGVIVDDPDPAPSHAYERLTDLGAPVVVNRRRMRSDTVAGAARIEQAYLVTVDGFGPRPFLRTWVRDAVGWARVLAGGPLRPIEQRRTGDAIVLALVSDAAVPVSVTCTVGGPGSVVAIDALAIAPRRSEVRIDEAAGLAETAVVAREGRLVQAPRLEAPERLSVRRLLEAISAESEVHDLAHLRLDDAIARSAVDARRD